ncbi:MAG: DNA topology modulation protein FlaR [Pseudomonadota bacterium]
MDQPSDFGGLFSSRRIVVVGANGAGKTWLATRLATVLDLTLVHHDALALTTQWVRRPEAQVQAAREQVAAKAAWIIEGGPLVLKSDGILNRADVIIWLDLPRHVRVWRIFHRTLRYLGRQRPEHPPGNREWPGTRQMRFLVKAWRSDAEVRSMIVQRLPCSRARVIRLKAPQDVRDLVTLLEDRAYALS